MSSNSTTPRLLADLALSRPSLDRADHLRGDPDRVEALWQAPTTTVLLLNDQYVAATAGAVSDGGVSKVTLVRELVSDTPLVDSHPRFFLGLDSSGVAHFAVDVVPAQRINGGVTLREVGAQLSGLDAEIFTTALGLANWHRRHPRCPICGNATVLERAGWVRSCPADDSEHFPRTDPAVIVLVIDPMDRALLGRRANWAQGWYSTLAGFVEPGESAEQCVAREVGEEASVRVDPTSLVFLGSQPWPFPSSLMLGFHAYATSAEDPTPDGDEIAAARWFTREELRSECVAGSVQLPSRVSIARHLIERWYGEALPGEWLRP